MEKKFIIIVLASAVALSSMIFFGISSPDLQLMIIDKKIFTSKTDNSNDFVSVHFSPEAKRILDNCEENHSCLFDSLNELAQTEDQKIVLSTYLDITNAIHQTEHGCHFYGHDLGNFLYSYTGNLSKSLLVTDSSCGGAIFHGIMQEYFRTNVLSNSIDSTAQVSKEKCNELFTDIFSQNRFECAHGQGHGLVIGYNYDYFSAVKKCDEFKDRFAQRSCVEGATMEYDDQSRKIHSESNTEDDIFFPCSKLEEIHAKPCYNYHGGYILKNVDGSAVEAFKQCEKIKNEMFVRHCYYGIGLWKGFFLTEKLERIIELCQKGNLNYQKDCFSGAVNIVTDQTGINQGFKLCKILPDNFKLDCYNIVGKWIHTIYFTEEEIVKSCSVLRNAGHYQVCVNANPKEIGLI